MQYYHGPHSKAPWQANFGTHELKHVGKLPLHEPYNHHDGGCKIPAPKPNDVQKRRCSNQAENNPLCELAHVPLELFEVVDVDLGVIPIG